MVQWTALPLLDVNSNKILARIKRLTDKSIYSMKISFDDMCFR